MDKSELAPPLTEDQEAELGELEDPVLRAAMDAINDGKPEEAERLLASMALPPRHEIQRLERRINTALRQATRPRPPLRRPAPARATRPRSRRATSRARARSPGREPEPDEPPAVNHAAALDATLDVRERLVHAIDELDADDPSSARFLLEGLLADIDAAMDGVL